MTFRPLLLCLVAALAGVECAVAQQPAPAAASAAAPAAPAIPPAIAAMMPVNKCVKPDPVSSASTYKQVDAFNKGLKVYGECVKKYVDDTRAIANAANAAGNAAIDDYNTYADELKKKSEQQ